MFEACPLTFSESQNRFAQCIKQRCAWFVVLSGSSDEIKGECSIKNLALSTKAISTDIGRQAR